jgi:putative heme iron utilization protein
MSYSVGFPVFTAQKEQDLVHILPKIIKVAVPAPQHSPILGQLPDWQIVCNL